LVKACILKINDDESLKFHYRYIFYFFAAKKISESLRRDTESKRVIEDLVKNIHLEKSSNIILFITHHSKDPWILDEILYCVMEIFSNEQEISLDNESLLPIKDFIKQIPEIILESRDARDERSRRDIELDTIEENEDSHESEVALLNEEKEISEFITKVNKLFRSVEVCGQILRNRIGSMERSSLESIYEESLSVSLRFLSVFLRYTKIVKEASIRQINRIIEHNPNILNSELINDIEKFYLTMNYQVILGMLYKISLSLGSVKGRDIYHAVTEKKNSSAAKLVQEIIELEFEKRLDVNKIEKLHHSFLKNPACESFLKQIVVRHIYTHDIGYKDRQKIAQKLNIPIKLQRSLMLSEGKK
jgi:hypothetical protein